MIWIDRVICIVESVNPITQIVDTRSQRGSDVGERMQKDGEC